MGKPAGNKNLPDEILQAIILGRLAGNTTEMLAQQFQRSKRTIQMVLKRFNDQGQTAQRKSTGRPRKTSKDMDESILQALREDPRRSSEDIRLLIATTTEHTPSARTIQRRLNAEGIVGKRTKKVKPTEPQKKKDEIKQ